eukprot:CAMPEP_0178404166 /NCGR_PEP_ID=MMETSP0689_2-20121128/17740_1 /TAXON_ID=160604 /ORGANISM="Amphidinium massartii, Strain CS-259" /LENGTH=1059 /DNA_ID=CAMNT_0020025135 /DNA_START=238 /DNA_END=3413 /DNA_ORIENTATION=-
MNTRALAMSGNNAMVNLADLHLSAGSGFSTSLDAYHSALSPPKSVAELSSRRKDSIKASYRRCDTRNQGWVTTQDLAGALREYSHLSPSEQQRLVHGITRGEQRVSFAQFAGYYQVLSSHIERDRDFEDLMRHHWGFAEVSDILEDMKNKFAMVGLAYSFRHHMEGAGGHPELSFEAFQSAISQVGMHYSSRDMRRVFDAFGDHSDSQSMQVLRLTEHLTRAPRPHTPIGRISNGFHGTAHISEVNSQSAEVLSDLSITSLGGPTPINRHHANFHQSDIHRPSPPPPPEDDADMDPDDNPKVPLPTAPPEDEDHRAPKAPMEGFPHPQTAPAEDDDGELAPDEKENENPNAPSAPEEKGDGKPFGGLPHHPLGFGGGGGGMQGMHQHNGMNMMSMGSGGVKRVGVTGQRKAVTVGINYIGLPVQLSGCVNDSDTFVSLLTDDFGFNISHIRQLRDDQPQRMPTKKNMVAALNWLVAGASPGDHLFFHYSGHGSQQADQNNDEMDGKDETLVPVDYQTAGMLSDDDMRRILVSSLPKGVRLTVILDCCHSGTALDLPYKMKLKADGEAFDIKKKLPHKIMSPSEADVVLISGCMDTQTSSDIGVGMAGNSKPAGAMTTSFKTVITRKLDSTYHEVLQEMRKFLVSKGFKQVPQLSSEQYLNLTECFMPEHAPIEEPPPPSLRPPARKAVTIGINYMCLEPGRGRLAGCINDSDTMIGILKDVFRFQDSQIHRLRDDTPNMMPTKANMLNAFHWLTQGAAAGDELFLHYSGHGGQQKDKTHEEADGKDETLIPCDFQTAGQITDDQLYSILVQALPKGVRMWVILDCCHSGTALDLRYKVTLAADGRTCQFSKSKDRAHQATVPPAEVIMISGCKDNQTSADVQQAGQAAGAMTTAFHRSITPTITCEELLVRMRSFLKQNRYAQVPQMSSDQFISLNSTYVDYQQKRKQKPHFPSHASGTRDLTFAPTAPGMQPAMPQQQMAMPMVPPGHPQALGPCGGGAPPAQAAGPGAMRFHGQGSLDASDIVMNTRIQALEHELARLQSAKASQMSPPAASPASPA